MPLRGSRGFSLIEALIGLVILSFAMTALSGMLIQNARINKSQQMTVEVQNNARSCLSILVGKLRSAGWDPMAQGIGSVTLDPENIDANHTDGVDNVDVFADLNADAETDGTLTDDDDEEQVRIRHTGTVVEWRPKPSASFMVLAVNISNDADGDGTAEPLFIPDDPIDPSVITVTVTAESPFSDPVTKGVIRYTVSSDVVLRKAL